METAEGSRQYLGALRLCRVSVLPSPSPDVGGGRSLSAGQLLPAQGVGGFGGPALGTWVQCVKRLSFCLFFEKHGTMSYFKTQDEQFCFSAKGFCGELRLKGLS